MGKKAFIFPGQGAQYAGMGKDFYENIPVSREMFQLAGEAANLDIAELCFTENDRLNLTEYTQIAMLAVEVAILKAVEEKGITADVTGGLSLGEYGALVAAGVLLPADVFRVVRKRGIYMQEAVPQGGAMTAVLGLSGEKITACLKQIEGIVSVANYNCPGQVVITGEAWAVAAAAEELTKCGAKRCIPLKVSGPFHSPLMVPAGGQLGEILAEVPVQAAKIPYIANVTADYVTDSAEVKRLLEEQVSAPVKWQQSVEKMIADGVTTFIEIGPGKTLSGFVRKINSEVTVMNVEKVEDLAKL